MSASKPQREVIQRGAQRDIAYAQTADGAQPAKEFYLALSARDSMSFAALFLQMAEHGFIGNPEKFRPNIAKFQCGPGDTNRTLAEFKIHHGPGQRILAYQDGRQSVLVSGCRKGAHLATEIRKAGRIACEDAAIHGSQQNS